MVNNSVRMYSPDGKSSKKIPVIDIPGWEKKGWLTTKPIKKAIPLEVKNAPDHNIHQNEDSAEPEPSRRTASAKSRSKKVTPTVEE